MQGVFEEGVLRPLEPLSLPEKKHVLVTITDVPVMEEVPPRKDEQEWLSAHGHEYRGEWLALQGKHASTPTATGQIHTSGHIISLEALDFKFESMVYFFADHAVRGTSRSVSGRRRGKEFQ